MNGDLPSGLSWHELDTAAFLGKLDTIVSVYENAKRRAASRELITWHTRCRGFRCVAAVLDDDIIGFIYGTDDALGTGLEVPGPLGRGAHHVLKDRIAMGHVASHWGEAFDIAEVHVREVWQGRTVGTNLIRRLCGGLPGPEVVLLVKGDSRARALYRRLGFRDLLPAGPRTRVVVMGASLPLLSG